MKRSDFDLMRLLKAAAGAPAEPVCGPPFGLETRVIQAWRSGIGGVDEEVVWLGLFRGVFVFSLVVMLVSVLLGYPAVRTEPNYELLIANSVIQMSFAP